jgi:hypothetical protein
MKMTYLTLFISLKLCFVSLGQSNTSLMDWEWINTYGNDSNCVANSIVVDEDLNLYVGGLFKDVLTIEGQTINGQLFSFTPFISKWDQNGDLLWINNIDSGWATDVRNFELDTSNNLYILADQTQLLIYDGQSGSIITYYSLFFELPVAVQEYFVNFKMTSDNEIVLLSLDYTDINNLTCKLTKCSLNDHYIENVLWSKSIELGGFFMNTLVYDIDIDDEDNVYIGGRVFDRELSIISDSIQSVENTTGGQVFLCKFDSDGNALWLDTISSMSTTILNLAVNSEDSSLYFTGAHGDTEIWNLDTLVMNGMSMDQILLGKYSTNGVYQWAKSYPLYSPSEKSFGPTGLIGTHVVVSDSGYVYLKGSFTGTIIFNADTLYEDTTVVFYNQTADDVFLAKLDSAGNAIWGKYAGNGGGFGNQTGGFWVDETGEIVYMVGFDADQNNNKAIPSNSIKRIFIAREGEIDATQLTEFDTNSIFIYPNPSNGKFTVRQGDFVERIEYSILNSNGRLLKKGVLDSNEDQIDLTNYSSGQYFLVSKYGSVTLTKD